MSRPSLRKRANLVRRALTPPATPAPASRADAAAESRELAAEVGAAFGRLVEFYRAEYRLTAAEVAERAQGDDPDLARRALEKPPDQVTWLDLDRLDRAEPGAVLPLWERIKAAAADELRTGHRAARALEEGQFSTCWGRARFVALRAELAAALRPRNALELLQVDQLAQFQTQLFQWQEVQAACAFGWGAPRPRGRPGGPAGDGPPRLTDAEALEQATRMVERLHALYLRTLRALEGLRRSPAVAVGSARLVNVPQAQVNLSG
jgi:hypothetical protein